jgi:hypothetical protein
VADSGPQEPQEPTFRESFADAMRKTGIGQVAPGEVPTAASLLKAVGGARGIVESIVPGLGFLVAYSLTKNLLLSVLIPLALAVVFLVIRIVTHSGPLQALTGILLLAVSAVIALLSGKAEGNFIVGIWTNSAFLLVILISLAVRWPLIGVIVGFLTNEITEWRKDASKRRVLVIATWLWALLFGIRLGVELPLYFAHNASALAAARLVTGVPLYAIFLWITWLLVRTVYAQKSAAKKD